MKKLQKISFSRKPIFFIFFIIIIIFIISAFFEYNSRKKSITSLMSRMSKNLVNSIETAAVNAILNYDKIEEETAGRMLTSLKMVKHLESEVSISEQFLQEFARENNLYKVDIIDSVMAKRQYPFLDFDNEEYFGIHFIPGEPTEKFLVALKHPPGKIYIAMIEAEELTQLQKENGITPLINNLIADSSIVYIAVQDTLGIIAATHNIKSLSSVYGDDFLQQALKQEQFQHRTYFFDGKNVFESVLPFRIFEADYGLIRIGINYQPIEELNRAAVRNAFIRMGILGLVLLILFAYSLVLQKLVVINDEKEKITAEVYRLQEDLRRKEKITAMGELAAGVAHEIRNPLNAISMSVQRLGKSLTVAKDNKESRLITSIRSEIGRVSKIIKQFLDFARPAQLNKSETDLNELIDDILEVYIAKLSEKNIELNWQPGKLPPVSVDAEKMNQVIINLLENAINAMKNSGQLTISTGQNSDGIVLRVQDTGTGIPPENLPKIFNLYFTTRPEGNGLGLAEVAQIIAQHNGKIDVKSEPGKFTAFKIILPKE